MTQRLTNHDRNRILAALTKNRFIDTQKALCAEFAELARDVRRDKIGRHRLGVMAGIPKGYLPLHGTFRVNFGGEQINLSLSGALPISYSDRRLRQFDPDSVLDAFPNSMIEDVDIFASYPADHELSRRWQKLCGKFTDHIEECRAIRREVTSVLASFTTSGALIKHWPEIGPIVRELGIGASAKHTRVPAPCVENLNVKLALAS